MKKTIALLLGGLGVLLGNLAGTAAQAGITTQEGTMAVATPDAIKVSDNHHYLMEASTGKPFFLLADTAWNLNALTNEEVDIYLKDRAGHGFNTVMFCLDFFPQAAAENAYGQAAYVGADKTELNPQYFSYCDRIVNEAGDLGLHMMLYAMWGGKSAGIMNTYTPAQLHTIGVSLGARYKTHPNVILVAGGESTPPYVDVERVNAIGSGLKEGCEGKNLVVVHPCSNRSSSLALSDSGWLDFYMSQVKSGKGGETVDMTQYVSKDFGLPALKPTMVVEHRYEVGTGEPPVIQRRSLYCSVFAGGCGYAYGHNALWQMSPHTAQKWMLSGWNPGVAKWSDALDTVAVDELKFIKPLLYSRPYFSRIPDQKLILAGQGDDIADRVQATRDGEAKGGANYIFVYIASPKDVTIDTSAIAAKSLNACWFDPENGACETIADNFANPGKMVLAKRTKGQDWVAVIDDASKKYAEPWTGDAVTK
jgi:hypothetical protein